MTLWSAHHALPNRRMAYRVDRFGLVTIGSDLLPIVHPVADVLSILSTFGLSSAPKGKAPDNAR